VTSARQARVLSPVIALAVLVAFTSPSARPEAARPTERLGDHAVVLDSNGKLLSWVQPQEQAYSEVVRLAWNQLLTGFPVEQNGLPTWLAYCCFDGKTLRGTAWPHNPASVYAGLAAAAAAYHAYTGDRRVVDFTRRVLDHQLSNGTTPAHSTWAWPSVPYASADHGARSFRGAHDFLYAEANDPRPRLGRGDGYGVIEPDKVGELGLAYLTIWKLTGDERYREAAVACARVLARHVRVGDATRSPWPFRVVAETGVVREEYCANLAFTLRLFDELVRLEIGDVAAWRRARGMAWEWAVAYPLRNDVWANYFEDLFLLPGPTNLTQYVAGERARYLLEDPSRDPNWRSHADRILTWIERTFGGDTPREQGRQWGAVTISEQVEYMYKMASDGYGDYIRHFMVGLGAVPAWAPPGEDHVLRSSSVVTAAEYKAHQVRYRTFDADGEEVLRLSFTPRHVTTELGTLEPGTSPPTAAGAGWTFDAGSGVLRVRRQAAKVVTVR
jgi:hypothetical protein